ncbi:SGNH/GDSL hydrolase family protein [Subtercola sp. RTI3]|uniref:SGNH/GDSL hydrolase family protein n=1 Tax=Subtercola sp. RTI3 TaxID=3048639 RepID=UPI002B23DF06|nr:SGNH/GDSL hydrolase family protein [Subtercola sp. RTI3]MEA9983839.1 SGNH/GDSL hydrolase family protein [Subtercola sp. RTI3]
MPAQHRTRLLVSAGVLLAAVALVGAVSLSNSRVASAQGTHPAVSVVESVQPPLAPPANAPSVAIPDVTASPVATAEAVSAGAAAATDPVVVAIGDSIMDGHGVDPDQAWPVLLADQNTWQFADLATDGTGFVRLGNDANTFEAQVTEAIGLDPSVVIISASSNDLGEDNADIADASTSALEQLHTALPQAQIIALSAFWGDTAVPEQLLQIDSDLDSAAQNVSASYVDIGQPLAGQPDLMQSDDVHPTADGLHVLASAIGTDIAGVISH